MFQCEDINIWHSKFVSHIQEINPTSHLGVKKYQDLSIRLNEIQRDHYMTLIPTHDINHTDP